MDSSQPAPSGSFLPFFLRNKWRAENAESFSLSSSLPSKTGSLSKSDAAAAEEEEQYPQITRAEKARIMHRVFTARQIEERMERISKTVLVDIQKQIHRGEEAYYEETNNHGSLFRGWDAFVDSKELGVPNTPSVPQGSRRIPADCRWFASSCQSISRPPRLPSILKQPLSRPPSVNSSSILPAPVPVPPPSSAAEVVSKPDPPTIKSSLVEKGVSTSNLANAETINTDVKPEEKLTAQEAPLAKQVKEDEEATNQSTVPVPASEKDPKKEGTTGDEPSNKTTPGTGTKRKKRDTNEPVEDGLVEPSPKRASVGEEKDKTVSDAKTAPVKGEAVQEEKMDIDVEAKSSGKAELLTSSKADDEHDVSKTIDTNPFPPTTSKTEEGKTKEPRKRRSSRKRKSS